jgi:hypothetical protein
VCVLCAAACAGHCTGAVALLCAGGAGSCCP